MATSAVYSSSNRTGVPFDTIADRVKGVAGAPAASSVVVTVECNGGTTSCTNPSRVCACLTGSSGFQATATCGATCPGSSGGGDTTSGYYLKVKASYRYIPTIVPATLFGDTMLEQSAVVRLQ